MVLPVLLLDTLWPRVGFGYFGLLFGLRFLCQGPGDKDVLGLLVKVAFSRLFQCPDKDEDASSDLDNPKNLLNRCNSTLGRDEVVDNCNRDGEILKKIRICNIIFLFGVVMGRECVCVRVWKRCLCKFWCNNNE